MQTAKTHMSGSARVYYSWNSRTDGAFLMSLLPPSGRLRLPAVKIHSLYLSYIPLQRLGHAEKGRNKITCVRNEDLDQPGHPYSLIRVFTVFMKNRYKLGFYRVDVQSKNSVDLDQLASTELAVMDLRCFYVVGFLIYWLVNNKHTLTW